MPIPQETPWRKQVRSSIGRLASIGIHEAPPVDFFDWCEHLEVRVDGLDGVGVIHQSDPNKPFQLCVFESSHRDKKGFAEVLERSMSSLDELPQRVEEWRAFRVNPATLDNAAGLVEHRKWLRAVAKDKRKNHDIICESGRLRAKGDIARSWEAAGFDVKIERPLPADTPELAKKHLLADLDAIAPDLLAWHLPRDDKGKGILNRRIPLFRYDGDKRGMSAYCLLVAMPEKRSGCPEVRAERLQTDLQTARLDAVPELFDTRRALEFAPELLGIEADMAHGLWSAHRTTKSPSVQSLRLQYAGDFVKAAHLVGLELDDAILDCMRARRVAHMCTCCAPLDQQLVEWSTELNQTLIALNFPKVAALVTRELTRNGRKPRKEPIPILPFPRQRHIRKAHIALDLKNADRPRLTIDTTGSGIRLPIAVWRRPEDVDLLREGLLDLEDLPQAVAAQLGIGTL